MTNRLFSTSRLIAAALVFAAVSVPTMAPRAEPAATPEWQSIKKDTFADREILDGAAMMTLEAPIRADDAAVVPLTVKMPANFAPTVKTLTLVIDKNPSPIVGTFNFGPAAGKGDRMLATRVRIDQYSEVRAIAETTDGKLYMTSRYVKASGGCSAPASKDSEEAAKTLGKMQIKTALAKNPGGLGQEGQIMIKHPNLSGLSMDQLTGLYAPARFINKIEVKSGGQLVFAMEGGISISEDPNFRFTYEGNPSDPMEVKAEDSDGAQFAGKSASSPS